MLFVTSVLLCAQGVVSEAAFVAGSVDETRASAILDSYLEVYGREPSIAEKEKWLADKR
ncbi:hypothetical protein FACS1894204_01160 [Synergistales bacterium]|nr:hypothetical protein FACS1894204_01160 [Synergistales bacterium]